MEKKLFQPLLTYSYKNPAILVSEQGKGNIQASWGVVKYCLWFILFLLEADLKHVSNVHSAER